jgi:hypothetical protein
VRRHAATEGLATCGPDRVADARRQVEDLATLARAIRPRLHPGRPHGPRCRLARHPHGARLCRLVTSLAALDVARAELPRGDVSVDALALRLVTAADAVRWCRQTAHPGGSCWFRSRHGGDCGEVLKLGHLLARSAA